jgi:hypothetical protein
MRDSLVHKNRSPRPAQVQNLLQMKLPPVKFKQQEQLDPSQVKPAEPQQALDSGRRTHGTTQCRHVQPPNANASTSYNDLITKPAVKSVPQVVKSPWSVIVESEYGAVLDALSAHCHPLSELKENGLYIRIARWIMPMQVNASGVIVSFSYGLWS